MKRSSRIVAAGLLASAAAALLMGFVRLKGWGGRMEVALRVLGDPVWVTVDFTSPRLWFLLVLPAVLLASALSLSTRRPGE